MAIFSTKGIMAIVPKNKVNWVKKKLNEGCHECIDEFVKTLPDFDNNGQKAEDGVVLGTDPPPTEETDPPKRRDPNQKFYESETIPDTYQAQYLLPEVGVSAERPKSEFSMAMANLNPKNWFVEDYSRRYDTRDEAYAAARQAGLTEFMYNGERFNTKMAGTPQQQLDWSGITDERIHERKFWEEKGEKNVNPFSYAKMEQRAWDAFIKDEVDPERQAMEERLASGRGLGRDKRRKDAFNLYLGKPQSYDTFSISKYRPSRSTDNDATYYSINMDDQIKNEFIHSYERVTSETEQQIKNLNLTNEQAVLLKQKYLHTEDETKYGFIPVGPKMKEEIPNAIKHYLNEPKDFSSEDKKNLKKFLIDAGKRDLADKIASDSKLNEKEQDVLKQFEYLSELFKNYDPKTKSVISNDQNAIMGQYNLSKGVDPETGREYISYKDLWDIKPSDFGKPFEIYDRIYLDEFNQDKK